jgi:hypothetical protein
MMINKHGTFYIRNGWPTKILASVREDNHIFSPNSELEAVDSIGMGRVMIRALRYWSDAMGLTVEQKDPQGLICEETALFKDLFDNDFYLQDIGSLWLLHRELAKNEEKATAWYWAFNVFDKMQFTKEDFVDAFYAYAISQGAANKKPAFEKEFDCFKNTYVSDGIFDVKKIMEEDTIPFFAPLALITTKGGGVFEKHRIKAKSVPSDVLLYCIVKDNENHLATNRQIGIETLLEQPKQVGKYFSITYSVLIEMLQTLENQGRLKLFNNFGNRHIELETPNTEMLLNEYFQSIGR